MARRRRKAKAASGLAGCCAASGGAGALPRRGADRLAGSGKSRLDRAGAGHDHLSRRQRHPRRHHHAGARRKGWTGRRMFRAARLRRAPTRTRAGSRSGRASERVYLDTPTWWDITPRTIWSGADRRQARDARRICARALITPCARSGFGRRNIAACGPRSAPTSRSTRHGRPTADRPSGLRPVDAFYRATGKASALRTCNAGCRNWLRLAGVQDEPVAAVRPRARLAISEDGRLTYFCFLRSASPPLRSRPCSCR